MSTEWTPKWVSIWWLLQFEMYKKRRLIFESFHQEGLALQHTEGRMDENMSHETSQL